MLLSQAEHTEGVQHVLSHPLAQRLERTLDSAATSYYRLILVAGPSGSGKSLVLREFAAEHGAVVTNVGLILSERLVGLSPQQQALRVSDLLSEVLVNFDGPLLVLDNLEVLFGPALRIDPLRVLQALARARLVVAAWPGTREGLNLTYAEPGHPEHRRYSRPDAILISEESAA